MLKHVDDCLLFLPILLVVFHNWQALNPLHCPSYCSLLYLLLLFVSSHVINSFSLLSL